MDEILKQIHYYAQQLKGINMWQAAGDYDYISSFLDSPRWNDGEYYGVVPRGEETVDEYSHNCPIPFTANRCLVSRCYDNNKALEILNKLSDIFNTLKSDVSGDGLAAINAYIENTNLYIELLGGEPVPPGPVKEPILYRFFDNKPTEYIYGDSLIITLDKAKPIDHGEIHVLDVSPSVLSKGKLIDHGAVEVITPEIMPMMAARMIDHGAVSVLDVELDRIVEPEPEITIITMYMVSGDKYCQMGVKNSSFPNSSYCYQLYTSDSTQTSSTQFMPNPDKDYISGYYDQSGEWHDTSNKTNVVEMPSTTGKYFYLMQVLSNGKLWCGYNQSSGSAKFNNYSIAQFRVTDKRTYTSYLNSNKSQSTLTPSYSYNWLLYDDSGNQQTANSNVTYTLKPAISGLYLLVDAGRLYLNGTPTQEITLSSVSYTAVL
jgi:hypothetical protein